MPFLSRTDNELWEAIKRSDKQAFDLLFERYWQIIYTTAFSYLSDREACSAITNDIFLNIWLKRETIDILSPKNYLTAAARYHVYKQLKVKKASKLMYIEDYDELISFGKTANKGAEDIIDMELAEDVDQLLNKLPKRCREIFVMSRIESLTNSEIADKLSISKRTVENQITVALKYMRAHLKYIAFFILLLK